MRLMLSIMLMGMMISVGSAFDDRGSGHPGGDHPGDYAGDHGGSHDFGGHSHYDWLNPGGYYSYSYWYPTYTYTYPNYYAYPSYYTYPTYYTTPVVTTPVVYPTTYYTYYDPISYDPWYAANVYGWGGATYYYSSSWSWSRYGGYYFV